MDITNAIFSVEEIFELGDGLLRGLGYINVDAELSSVSFHAIGVFLSLRDQAGASVLKIYVPKQVAASLGFVPEVGMRVTVNGRLSVYKPRSEISLLATSMKLSGEGDLHAKYKALEQKLKDEGLFNRKRLLPEKIKKIALLTSKHGAVLSDFTNNLFKNGFELSLIPVRVEGREAVGSIKNGLDLASKLEVDLVVLMRGGGSFEDLLPFSDETVVRKVAAMKVPVVSAIGHDRDMPLVCLASDAFTSTPTAAAMLINETVLGIRTEIDSTFQELESHLHRLFDKMKNELDVNAKSVKQSLFFVTQQVRLLSTEVSKGILDCLQKQERMVSEVKQDYYNIITSRTDAFGSIVQMLDAFAKIVKENDPETQLKKGFVLVSDKQGNLIKRSDQVVLGDSANLHFYDAQRKVIFE